MSEITNNSAPVSSSSTGATAANTTAGTTANQAAYSSGSGGGGGTMEALKKEHPKVYKFIMLSIAQNMCLEMQHRNQQLTQKMKKMSQNN